MTDKRKVERGKLSREMGAEPVFGRLPMFLSAAVYPGAGQMAQRRWVAGTCFALLFTMALGAFFVCFVVIIMDYYALALNPDGADESPSVVSLLTTFICALAVYVVSLLDTWRAYVSRRHKAAVGRLVHPPPAAATDSTGET